MFVATIRNGRMSMARTTAHRFETWKVRMEGRQIQIDEYKPIRSNAQNRFYWVYLGVISDETGDDARSLHQVFKSMFLPPKFVTMFGKEVQVSASTTELDKQQFGEYMERIAALTGVAIPNPEEAGFISNHGSMK